MESVNSLRISAPQSASALSVKGETGSVKGETKSANFWQGKSVSSAPIVRIFGKGKCKFLANFSAAMVTSLPSHSLPSLSLSLSPRVPHAQYRKRFRASYNSAPQSASALSVKGETGSVKGETKSANFWQGKSVSSAPIVRIFGKGKCKFIANFSAAMVTSHSLPSLSLSLSHREYLTHNIGSASALPIIQREREIDGSDVKLAKSFALFLAKYLHLSFSPLSWMVLSSHFPLPKTLHSLKQFAFFVKFALFAIILPLSNGVTGDRSTEKSDRIFDWTVLPLTEKMNQINTKNDWK